MFERFIAYDKQLLLYLNSLHTPFLDQLMWLASDRFIWIPLYLWFLWLLFREHRKNFWVVLIAIALMVFVSDQLCNFSKNTVMRLRPSNDPTIMALIHLVKGYTGGTYGFYSAHASNSFAVATFVSLTVQNGRKLLIPVAICFALLVSYSRIYLGVHFPGDVLTGMIAGILTGFFVNKLFNLAVNKVDSLRLKKTNPKGELK
ncbi:MAG: phosphatase PAP2 family protein [Bacteroidales bacterium]|nr:phosphatase PAP2 family protein [Bacteroidales bacterium]